LNDEPSVYGVDSELLPDELWTRCVVCGSPTKGHWVPTCFACFQEADEIALLVRAEHKAKALHDGMLSIMRTDAGWTSCFGPPAADGRVYPSFKQALVGLLGRGVHATDGED
jgi:hypothetical protein